MTDDLKLVERLRAVIRDTLWMAQRYTNGRQSYAVGMYNRAAKEALALGAVTVARDHVLWALDGGGTADLSGLHPDDHQRGLEYQDDRDRLAKLVAEMREGLADAAAHLAGAASAYRAHAARHRSVGRATSDPFFTTRVGDFDRAAERARALLQHTQEQVG